MIGWPLLLRGGPRGPRARGARLGVPPARPRGSTGKGRAVARGGVGSDLGRVRRPERLGARRAGGGRRLGRRVAAVPSPSLRGLGGPLSWL